MCRLLCAYTRFLLACMYACVCVCVPFFVCVCVLVRLCVRFLALLRTYEWCARYNVVIDTFWYQITWNYNKQHGTQTHTRTHHIHTHTQMYACYYSVCHNWRPATAAATKTDCRSIASWRNFRCSTLYCECRDRHELICIGQAQNLCYWKHVFVIFT